MVVLVVVVAAAVVVVVAVVVLKFSFFLIDCTVGLGTVVGHKVLLLLLSDQLLLLPLFLPLMFVLLCHLFLAISDDVAFVAIIAVVMVVVIVVVTVAIAAIIAIVGAAAFVAIIAVGDFCSRF